MPKENIVIIEPDARLEGCLFTAPNSLGLVVFSQAGSSGKKNAVMRERNNKVADAFAQNGFSTLLLDLLTEEEGKNRDMEYNIKLLSERLEAVMDWCAKRKNLRGLPLGLFGIGTGAAAAASAAAHSKHEIAAMVSLGGRIDMAEKFLPYIEAPCLLIAPESDELSLMASRKMLERIPYARLHVVAGASHSFTDGNSPQEAVRESSRWLKRYFNRKSYAQSEESYREENIRLPFYDRFEASHFLARKLAKYKDENPLVLAIPKGAIAMADIVSTELDCEMDVALVKKISPPDNPELAIGSVNEFGNVYLSSGAKAFADEKTINIQARAAQRNLKEYREKLGALQRPKDVSGRTVIIIDDGIATGSTMLSAVITVKEKGAAKVVVASPVVSPKAQKMLTLASDETVFLNVPENFYAVAQFYENFPQVNDSEVEQILK